jgi:uncharacterized protein (UPF0332 family)
MPGIRSRNNRTGIVRSFFYVVHAMFIAGQRLRKHSCDNGYAGNNWITSVAMQRAVNRIIEEEMFSMDPPLDYINSPVVNQKSVVERIREWSESSAVKGSAGG